MSQNRRARASERRTRPDRRGSTDSRGASGPPPRKPRPQWRETLDSWGGLTVVGTLAVVILVALFFILRTPLGIGVSDDSLMGDEFADVRQDHVPEGTLTESPPQPPAGGPHYAQPWPTGIFEETPADGHLIHSLEHGIVWISYHPDMVTEEQLDALEDVANDFSRDTILAPRATNDAAVYVMSWSRRAQVDPDDTDYIRDFIETNRNRAPEPGVR